MALDALLDDEVVFHSPVVHAPQAGKRLTMMYLAAAFQVFINGSFRYVREVVQGNEAVLEFELEIDGGTIAKRWMPRSMGRANRINHRTSHLTVVVTDEA